MIPVAALAALAASQVERYRPLVAALPTFDLSAAQTAYPTMGVTAEDDPAMQKWVRACLAEAMAKYPPYPLLRRLKGVCVVRLMWWDQTYLGGTPSVDNRKLLLSVGTAGITSAWLEQSFHHELAHILQLTDKKGFPKKAWEAANAPGFEYAFAKDKNGGYAALQGRKTGKAFVPALNALGLLSEYGSSTFEEDWACYGESILYDDPGFWALAAKYPRVREKARMAIAYYRRAMPGIRLPNVEDRAGSRL